MGDDLDIGDAFEAQGMFFSPPAYDGSAHILGRIVQNGRGLLLERAAHTVDPGQAFNGSVEHFESLLGVTTRGDCSLFDVFQVDPESRLFLDSGQLLATGSYRINSCIMGAQIKSRTESVVELAQIRFAGLEHWLGSEITQTHDGAKDTFCVSHPLQPAPLITRTISGLNASISISRGYWSQHTHFQSTISGKPVITITPDENRSLDWFLETADRLENFFSLVLGVSTALTSMKVKVGAQNGSFLHRRLSKAKKPDRDLWISCTPDKLFDALQQWFSVPNSMLPIENLIFGTIRNSSLFVETEFLSLAQACESFHRVTDAALIMNDKEFSEVKRVLCGLIDFFFWSEPDIRVRLRESIAHANQPSFRNRLKGLIGRLNPGNAHAFLGDCDKFIQNVTATRNFFTHPGTPYTSAVVTDGFELFRLNEALQAFLRIQVLMHMGFAEHAVYDSVVSHVLRARQIRKL